ncbi:MAG: methionyl-tRNA formyltransferase [Clostridiales bacterium]|nr:methionyl-tRNA formyltransferase [Clostridiales bacterium]MCF8022717.1 methionyl-tRNA formyltransferase [Clostridiales bacterium]
MRIVFMGSPDFAIPSLRILAESPHKVSMVITQPDKPRGRGKILASTPVKKLANILGIPVYQPEKLASEEVINKIKQIEPTVIVVVAYGKILPRELLDIPGLGCVNVHASLLPKYRGSAPIHRALINGEECSGVSTMLMDTGMDTGNVLLGKKVDLNEDDTAGVLHDRLAEEGACLLLDTLDGMEKGEISSTPQNDSEATYAPPLIREDEIIDWGKTALEVKNKVRGLNPWPGARTVHDGKVLKVWKLEVLDSNDVTSTPGTVLEPGNKGDIIVQTGVGTVRILELQIQGGKKVNASDFLRGRSLPEGTMLGRS